MTVADAGPGIADAALEGAVRAFIAENFLFDPAAPPLPGEASLTQTGVLDSMGVLELILFLEERYGFAVPDEDTLPENLDSVDRIVC
jgi:acyl carrier protein